MSLSHAPDAEAAARATRRVTTLSVLTASVLVALKAGVWLLTGSVSLLASAADSGLDLLAAGSTFFAVRYAAAPPDAEHRYGHGKAEAFAGLLQAGLVFASAALIGQEAILRIIHPRPVIREGLGIAVMAASILGTAALIWAQTAMLRQGRSVAVSADRMHYVSDLASNLIALAAIGVVALTDWYVVDAFAALAIAGVLLWGAIVVFRQASGELLDRELPEEARAQISALVTEDPRLTDVHQLRTRASGPMVHIQMHVDLDPDLTLETAHHILIAAENRILTAFPAADILIHTDPRGRAEPHGGPFGERAEPAGDRR